MNKELIEKIAILIAEANNGGKWATHYVEEHKLFWKKKAETIINIILEEQNGK